MALAAITGWHETTVQVIRYSLAEPQCHPSCSSEPEDTGDLGKEQVTYSSMSSQQVLLPLG